MTGRIATSVLVAGLIRKAETQGGFAALLAKGDPTSGSVLVVLFERGGSPHVLERILQPDGAYKWQPTTSRIAERVASGEDVPGFIASRRRFDPDLWVLELDIPSAERFAAEMNADA